MIQHLLVRIRKTAHLEFVYGHHEAAIHGLFNIEDVFLPAPCRVFQVPQILGRKGSVEASFSANIWTEKARKRPRAVDLVKFDRNAWKAIICP